MCIRDRDTSNGRFCKCQCLFQRFHLYCGFVTSTSGTALLLFYVLYWSNHLVFFIGILREVEIDSACWRWYMYVLVYSHSWVEHVRIKENNTTREIVMNIPSTGGLNFNFSGILNRTTHTCILREWSIENNIFSFYIQFPKDPRCVIIFSRLWLRPYIGDGMLFTPVQMFVVILMVSGIVPFSYTGPMCVRESAYWRWCSVSSFVTLLMIYTVSSSIP